MLGRGCGVGLVRARGGLAGWLGRSVASTRASSKRPSSLLAGAKTPNPGVLDAKFLCPDIYIYIYISRNILLLQTDFITLFLRTAAFRLRG